MLAVQRPAALFPAPAFSARPSHSRNPSAPVVVRPTHTPGLLSLSKPAQQHPPRSQQAQQYARAPRSSTRAKAQRAVQQAAPAQSRPTEDSKKASELKARTDDSSPKAPKSATAVPPSEKSLRGRQPSKPAAKDKADRRSPSPVTSSARPHARRPHQPSPSPTRIPQQAEPQSPINPFRAQSYEHRGTGKNLFDSFLANSSSDNESDSNSSPAKSDDKPSTFRAPPALTSPSGKLARRRRGAQNNAQTPSKAVPVPRAKGNHNAHAQLAHSEPTPSAMATPRRPIGRAQTTALPLAEWEEFPVCDETVLSPPSTPVRPSASAKRSGATWQQAMLDDAPRTAPLSSTFTFPFAPAVPCATPSPAHRRRHHHRVPSEGVFAMSTDEESSTDSSDELKKTMNAMPLFGHRAHTGARRTPSPPAHGCSPASFYAGSVFQNSPSPDDLPVPAFRA
ncbi:hypothetical protein EIP86_008532 [Pleurotus ostreatoroseus]|nr:hypothetical protein EIP86_008532 [Pleurotus ostreatoroseus]